MNKNECVRFDIIRKVTGCLLLRPRAAHASLLNPRRLLNARRNVEPWVLEEWLTNNNPELMKGTDEDRSKVVAAIKECVVIYQEGEMVTLDGERFFSLDEAVKRTLFEEMDNNSKSSFEFEEYLLDSIMERTKNMPSYLKNLDFWTNVDELSVRKLGPVLVHSGKHVNLHPHLRIAGAFIVDMRADRVGADDEDGAQTVAIKAVIQTVAEKKGGAYVLKPDTSSTAKRKHDESGSLAKPSSKRRGG